MSKVGISLLLICCSIWTGTAYSLLNSQQSPPRHYEDYGACPFECCTYRQWTVNSNTIFYKDRSASSPIVFRAKKGEHVTGLTGVVITLKPGKAIVKKATTLGIEKDKVRVKAEDILYLLHYEGEAVYKFWFHGRIYEAEMPFAPGMMYPSPEAEDKSREFIQQVSEPETVWWVKVRNRRGQIGWSKQDDHFDDMDACGQ